MGLAGATILQVVPELSAGGAERTTIEIAAALAAAGARPIVASAGGRLDQELERAGGVLLPMPTIGSRNPLVARSNAAKLAEIVRKENVAIIHARSRAPAWAALWAARRTGAPFVTTYHGVYNARSSPKRLYNSVMARGDIVIANSEFTASHVRREHGFAADRIVTIPRGVDLAMFSREAVTEQRRASLAEQWRLPRSAASDSANGAGAQRLILLPARLTGWKGHREAIAAARLLAARTPPDWRMIFAGDPQGRDAYVKELLAQIDAASLSEHIEIVGHCSDMPAAFALANIVIAPSNEPEAFGRVAVEAGAMGVPVIGSNTGGQREVISHGKTGLLVAPGNPSELADAIESLLALSPQELHLYGEAARSRIATHYSVQALQAATLAVYEKLLGHNND